MLYSEKNDFTFGPGGFAVTFISLKGHKKQKQFFLKPMQYLNYFDKHGIEICEKDIVENEFGKKLCIRKGGEVFFIEEDKLEIPAMFLNFSKIKIIGNLFEHPHLIS
jgi:hypothetical protein